MNEHIPTFALKSDGLLGVFCYQCSEESQDYVFCAYLEANELPRELREVTANENMGESTSYRT